MQILERTFVSIALTGFLMKVLLIPGGSEVLLIGCTLAAMFYWLLAFGALNQIPLGALFKKESYANIGAARMLGVICMGLALCVLIIGILFRLLLLQGATEMITVGGTTLLVILSVALAVMILKKKTSDPFYQGVFLRGGLILLIGVVVMFVPARNWVSLYHRDDPTYRDLFIKTLENPTDPMARHAFENYRLNVESASKR
jgi:hypothetical protein